MTLQNGIIASCVLAILTATACVGEDSASRPESAGGTSATTGGGSSSGGHSGGVGTGGLGTGGVGGSISTGTSSAAGGLPAVGGTSSGGRTNTGGATSSSGANMGGTSATGSAAAGGVAATGGAAGGSALTGGTSNAPAATGGAPSTNVGGSHATGGATATGGTPSTSASAGGSQATGGAMANGAQTSTGGATPSGGSSSLVLSGTGGLIATGGTLAAGGLAAAGGAAATGGAAVTGGSSSAGGSTTDYSGLWSGLTTQGKLASFRVYANAVTQFTIDWILPTVSDTCSPAGATTSSFGTPAAIAANATFTKGPVSANPTSLLFSGQFNSSTAASGTVGVSYSVTGCNSSSTFDWTAQKVVCGDGVMQWPETCDPGAPLPTATCSDQCQLFPVTETEPNDTIALANGPYTDDTLISASIATANDVDVFAVRNALAGSVSVAFETHGETVGTCDNADTFIQIARSDGTIIASDDDGSRMLYCSYAMVSVAAGETVYVAVMSSILQPIARYQLHIQFPHS